MSLRAQAVKNVSATWVGLAVQGVVSFLLAPFILDRLGDVAFSIWILIFSLTGYFGLLDLGIRSSIIRYTAQLVANDDRLQLATYLSTSLAFYGVIALLVLCLTCIGDLYLPLMFRIPAGLLTPARVLFLLSGVGVALTFPLSVFTGALEGLQKFAWLQMSHVGITLLRAALIVLAMRNGGGLLTIGAITIGLNLVGYIVFAGLAIHALLVPIRLKMVDLAAFRKMANYGLFASAILAAEKLRFQTDAMVIGAFLPAAAITMFAIGSKLVEYASYPVKSMAQIFTPIASEFHAKDDVAKLQMTLVAGNRACALIVFPICVSLVMLGRPIIAAWVGSRYTGAYAILILLLIPRTLYLAQSTSTKILLGMGQHRTLASVLLLEGFANLLLSLVLVRKLGVIGVALGTAIPLLLTSVAFLPRHLCNILKIPLSAFVRRAYGLPFALCIPLAAAMWFTSHQITSVGYVGIIVQLGIGGLVYCAMLAVTVWAQSQTRPRSWRAFSQLLEPR